MVGVYKMETKNIYIYFGGINKQGYLLGTIEGIEGGLNPIAKLNKVEIGLVRAGLSQEDYKKAIEKW